MNKSGTQDSFLEKYLKKYDDWLGSGRISYASRVIPVAESMDAQKWVLPTEQAMAILAEANAIALQRCVCRTHYKRCDNPLEVCFLLNRVADKSVAKGDARHVSMEEAAVKLKAANERGLIHLSLYIPDHELFALCSCCACCCHDLQIIKQYGRKDIMVRSSYEAITDPDECTHCGACIERCRFDARYLHDDCLRYDTEACVGCGLCVTPCPTGAVTMQIRRK